MITRHFFLCFHFIDSLSQVLAVKRRIDKELGLGDSSFQKLIRAGKILKDEVGTSFFCLVDALSFSFFVSASLLSKQCWKVESKTKIFSLL